MIMNQTGGFQSHFLRPEKRIQAMKRTTLITRASFLLICCCFSAAAQVTPLSSEKLDPPKLYEQSQPAVVLITVAHSGGKESFGSGVIVKPEGVIVTNFHVMKGAISARVQLSNGDIYDDVTILDTDERKDIAVIKIKAVNLSALSFADSDTLRVGSSVYAIGAPRGLEGSLSSGIVSSIRPGSEVSPAFEGFRVIQFSAPVSPGSSGGPLLDESGKIVGLVFGGRPGGQNLNFAIPANYVLPLTLSSNSEGRALASMPKQTKAAPVRSREEILGSAKTICVVVVKGNSVLKTEVTKKLIQWGKLTPVVVPEEADLILAIEQTARMDWEGNGNEATALLVDRESKVELWSTTKGGPWGLSGLRIASVARAIADEFIRFYDSTLKTKKPGSQ
jgi:S1-C subfamily serine protease